MRIQDQIMKLILARHGEALDFSSTGKDKDRELSSRGREDIHKMGRFIYLSSLRVTHIYYSPYVRTRQTAEIFAKELGITDLTESCDELAPGNVCEDMLYKIKNFSNSETILIVSHNPGIAHFAAHLIQDDALTPQLPFQPGTTIAINVAREKFAGGQIIWMISPNDLHPSIFLNPNILVSHR